MKHFKVYDKHDILSLTRLRRFETKIGERIQVAHDAGNIEQSIAQSNAKFVLFGVPEDMGVKANMGMAVPTVAGCHLCRLSSTYRAMIFLKEVK